MPATSAGTGVANPFVGTYPTQHIGTDVEKRLWAKWVEKFERKQFPVTNLIPQGKTPYNANKIRVGAKYNPFVRTALNGVTSASSQTITVDSTTGMRVGDIVAITDYQSGSTTALDNSTVEYARIEEVLSATTFTGTRDMDQTSSSAWPVHADNALVEVVMRASPNNATFANANRWRGDFTYNYGELFESALEDTIQSMHTPSEESSAYYKDDRANVVEDLKWFRENAFVKGIRMAGDETSTPTKPFTMGGIVYQIENFASANVNDLSNDTLDVWDVDDLLREVWGTHRKGPGTHVLGHQDTIAVWDGIIMPYKGGGSSLNDETFSTVTKKGKFRWGDIEPVPTISMPPGVLAFIDPSDWEWNHFEGENWTEVRQKPEEIWKPNEAWAMFGRFSIICKDINRQSIITNIQTDLDQYSFRSFSR
jgi:hypothetical protein